MINGNTLWGKEVEAQLSPVKFHETNFISFSGLPNSLYEMLVSTASQSPATIGLIDVDGQGYTYQHLLEIVDNFADYLLTEYGIQPGFCIGVLLHNGLNFYAAFLALSKLQAISVMLPTKYKANEVHALIAKIELNLLIADDCFQPWFVDLACRQLYTDGLSDTFMTVKVSVTKDVVYPKQLLERIAIYMFTSGTTSGSKVVELRALNIMHSIVAYQKLFAFDASLKTLVGTPLYHITGTVALLGLSTYVGGTLVLHKYFKPKLFLEDVIKYEVNLVHASPAVFHMLLREADNFPQLPLLKKFLCGSSKMPVTSILKIKEWLPNVAFHTIYGLTETSSPATFFPEACATSRYLGSSGIPIPGLTFKIVDEAGDELPYNQNGEIVIKGTNILSRYLSQTDSLDEDGWLHTGDIGYFNEDKYLYVIGRLSYIINHGGEKINPADVESEINQIAGVLESVVVGIPDPILGEVTAALVRLDEGYHYSAEEMREKLKGEIASFKIPSRFRFTDAIPLTKNMKIDNKAVKKMFR
ncbi:MAG: acyl--CoA ligase [Lachnospiraceae bacterium]|nr:acyl--CoA ligase [Lachnospiraceae bacterium]